MNRNTISIIPLLSSPCMSPPPRAQAAVARPNGTVVGAREALLGLLRHEKRRPKLVNITSWLFGPTACLILSVVPNFKHRESLCLFTSVSHEQPQAHHRRPFHLDVPSWLDEHWRSTHNLTIDGFVECAVTQFLRKCNRTILLHTMIRAPTPSIYESLNPIALPKHYKMQNEDICKTLCNIPVR